jgi:hypothetical protein
MMKFGFDFDRWDVVEAHYCFYVRYHGGQFSPEYARLSKISSYYKPGLSANDDPDKLDWAAQGIYRNLCAKHGVPSDITEDRIGYIRANGMMNYKLYSHWATSLIYGDDSGLYGDDIKAIESFLELEDLGECVEVWDDVGFGHPDCGGLSGDICTYIFRLKEAE